MARVRVTAGQRRADAAFKRALDRFLERLVGTEERNAALHARITARIQAEMHRGGLAPGVARRRADAVMRAFEGERIELVRQIVLAGATEGAAQRQALARAVFGDDGARRALRPNFNTDAVTTRVTAQRMRGDFTLDRLSVQQRMRSGSVRVADGIGRQVESSVRMGESFTQSAQRLMRSTDIRVALPRHIEEVAHIARTGTPGELQSEIRRRLEALRSARIPSHEIAADTRRFLERLRRTGSTDVDNAVSTWVQGRAQNQAMTIARTEGMNAHAQAFVESVRDEEFVYGVRWNLNPAHKRPDVCDVMAGQDLFGLGPGGYPANEAPALGHPNDLCFFTSIIDEDHFARRRAIRNGEPEPPRPWESGTRQTGRQWLQAQPEATRVAILGPGRAAALGAGGRRAERVVNAGGSLNPLYHVNGQRPPQPAESTVFVRRAGQEGRLTRPRVSAERTSGT